LFGWTIAKININMNTIKIEKKDNHAIIEMNNGKVNAINKELMTDLGTAFEMLAKDDAVKGVILSGRPHCFSAGLDIVELATAGVEGGKEFWRAYLGTLQSMIRFSKPFVCAITGFAPAGATILTIAADYRVMAKGKKHVIGMNEFNMSLQIPELLCYVFAYQIGETRAWKAIQNASLFSSDEALAVGLVDESVEVDQVLSQSEKQLQKLMRVHGPVFSKSKMYFRKALLEIVDRPIEPMIDDIAQDAADPFAKKMIEMFLQSLKLKK